MASYRGWNEEDLLKNGRPYEEIPPGASFTPINQKQAVPRTVNPLRTLRNADIYDLPDDAPDATTYDITKARKRAISKPKNNRSKLHVEAGSSEVVGQAGNDHEGFEVSSPKRRKAPTKRAQSMKTFKIPTRIGTYLGNDGDQASSAELGGNMMTQLSTPPDSNKRPNKRSSATVTGGRKKSSELFQSSGITKPSQIHNKSGKDSSQAVNRMQGFITTEDQLKLNSNGIANTTLQKLAAFTYAPPNTIHPDDIDESIEHGNNGQMASSDYGLIPSSDSFFEEALWHPKQVDSHDNATCASPIYDYPKNVTYQPRKLSSPPPNEEYQLHVAESLLPVSGQVNSSRWQLGAAPRSENPINSNAPAHGPNPTAHISQAEHLDLLPDDARNGNSMVNCASSDEFDCDIDDEDLLALETGKTCETIQKGPQLSQDQQTNFCVPPVKDIVNAAIIDAKTSAVRMIDAQHQNARTLSSAVETEDDEFLLDEDVEAAMLMLSGLDSGVKERFQPPPSLTLPSEYAGTDKGVYDHTLQFSPPKSTESAKVDYTNSSSPTKSREPPDATEDVDWGFIVRNASRTAPPSVYNKQARLSTSKTNLPPAHAKQTNPKKVCMDDSHEYLPLEPFVRPKFPSLVPDRCPVNGLSTQNFLRVCFRIGELLNEGGRCDAMGHDAIFELFARVNFSSREAGTTKQHFRFLDLFHDRPPFANGVLANFKTTALAEAESRVFAESNEKLMARCLCQVKRDVSNNGFLLHVINVRVTDWEEVRWTKRIVFADHNEKDKMGAKL